MHALLVAISGKLSGCQEQPLFDRYAYNFNTLITVAVYSVSIGGRSGQMGLFSQEKYLHMVQYFSTKTIVTDGYPLGVLVSTPILLLFPKK